MGILEPSPTSLPLNGENQVQSTTKWQIILQNRTILLLMAAICLSTSAMAILEPCLPIWLMEHVHVANWQLGTVFIPDSLGYFVGTNCFGAIAYRYGQIEVSCISLLLVGISSIGVSTALPPISRISPTPQLTNTLQISSFVTTNVCILDILGSLHNSVVDTSLWSGPGNWYNRCRSGASFGHHSGDHRLQHGF